MEEKSFKELKYLISYPEGFREDKKYPLVLFLHGAGTRGDIEKLKKTKPTSSFAPGRTPRATFSWHPIA